jgi:hypothetical protein
MYNLSQNEGVRLYGVSKGGMIEIREILLRIAKGQSKRKIRKDLKVHAQTVNRYIQGMYLPWHRSS